MLVELVLNFVEQVCSRSAPDEDAAPELHASPLFSPDHVWQKLRS